MTKYKFIKEIDTESTHDNIQLELTCETIDVRELCQAFEQFARGAGFYFEGMIGFIEEDD